MLFGYEWELTKSPAGAHQWVAKNCRPEQPDPRRARPVEEAPADDDDGRPVDAIRSGYEKISRRFHQDRRRSRTHLRGRGSS